jgi:hypothetical protein
MATLYLRLTVSIHVVVSPGIQLILQHHGTQNGFEVRKRYTNKRKSDGKVRSCRFICANEGHRMQDKRGHLTKCPRAETRRHEKRAVHTGSNKLMEKQEAT